MSEENTVKPEALPESKTISIPSDVNGEPEKTYLLTLDQADQEYFIPVSPQLRLVEKIFTGDYDRISYFVPEYLGEDGYKHAAEKWGGEKVSVQLSRQAAFDMAIKAKSRCGKYDNTPDGKLAKAKYIANLIRTNPYVVTPEDAENYVPGTRELTFKGMLMKAAEAQKEGNTSLAMEWLQKATQLAAREEKLTQ